MTTLNVSHPIDKQAYDYLERLSHAGEAAKATGAEANCTGAAALALHACAAAQVTGAEGYSTGAAGCPISKGSLGMGQRCHAHVRNL